MKQCRLCKGSSKSLKCKYCKKLKRSAISYNTELTQINDDLYDEIEEFLSKPQVLTSKESKYNTNLEEMLNYGSY